MITNECAVTYHAEWSGVVTCFAGGKPIICLFSHCISPKLTTDDATRGDAWYAVCLISHAKFSSSPSVRPAGRPTCTKLGVGMEHGVEEDCKLPRRSPPPLSLSLPGRKSGQ